MIQLKVKDHIPVELKTLNTGDLFIHEGELKNVGAVDSRVLMVLDEMVQSPSNSIPCVKMNGDEVGEMVHSGKESKAYRLVVVSDMVVELE